ncbi:MAG: LptA/OstA family protein [Syntrophales bacterium]|jgi:lipopolysaccharide export system protein LptA
MDSKKKNKWCFLIFCAAFFFSPLRSFAAGEGQGVRLEKSGPIQIVSDRLEAFQDEKKVVFSGHTVATQTDKVIKADKITLFYRKDSKESTPRKTAESSNVYSSGELERIEATGNVIITQGVRIVTGDEAVFFQDAQKIVMTGNAMLKEDKNIIRGERVLVYLNENRGVVESGGKKQVTATIYPKDEVKGKTGDGK